MRAWLIAVIFFVYALASFGVVKAINASSANHRTIQDLRSAVAQERRNRFEECGRDNTLRTSLDAGARRAYVLRVAQADGNPHLIMLAQGARDASLRAYAAHRC